MPTTTSTPRPPIGRVALAISGCAVLLAIGTALFVPAPHTQAALIGVAIGSIATLFSLPIMSFVAPGKAVFTQYLAAMGIRLGICVIGSLLAVQIFGNPARPVLLALAAAYLPLIFIEAAMLGRFVTQPAAHTPQTAGNQP